MAWNLQEAISHYKSIGAPADQNMLISLLREIQAESGGSIPQYVLAEITQAYNIKEGMLLALIRRIPSLRLGSGHALEMCAGPNCGKHRELAAFAESLQKEDGKFVLKFVPCMRMCGKGPNIKWDGKLYHQANKTLIYELVKGQERN